MIFFPLSNHLKNNFWTKSFNLFLAVQTDSSSGNFIAGGTVGGTDFAVPFGSLGQGNDLFFDDSTEIEVCSALNAANPIGCKIHNFQVGYSLNSFSTSFDFNDKGFFFELLKE